MAGGTFTQADVLCPFYMTDTDRPYNIKCEGISKVNRLYLSFPHKKDKDAHMKKYCTECYKQCRLFKTIYEQYEE